MDFNLRWNYSPLKKRLPKLPGGLFVCEQFSVLSSQFSVKPTGCQIRITYRFYS